MPFSDIDGTGGVGSFDCVFGRFADEHFAQDDM